MFNSRFLKLLGAVTIINIFARLFGFARELTIGYQYGTSYQADGIITAFTIPNFLYVVLGGAITTAFISVYSKLDRTVKHDFVQTLMTFLCLTVGTTTILFMIFPGFWMKLFFSGMSEDALTLTTHLFLVTAPATLFLVVSMVLSGLHNVHENYRYSSFAALIFNGVYLFIGVSLTPILKEYSYALGATLGALFMFLLLIYQIKKQQIVPLRFKIVKHPELKRLVKLAMPLILGGATLQFYLIIQRIFAAGLDDGAIAAINYASKMTQFPQGVLMTSVTTIVYPMLAKSAADGDFQQINQAYKKGFRMLTLLLIPASIFIFFYAEDVITFIFQYGNFSQESTNVTYPLLQVFSLSIFSLALNTYVTRFFYALERTLLPNILSIISVFGINIAVISLFIDQWGAFAIAIGTVVSTIINMLLLILFAKIKLQLIVCSRAYLVRLLSFVSLVLVIFWLVSFIDIAAVWLSLLLGGMITLITIATGLKLVK
ncbi:putative peptidoglycan lipid II flippase [Lentibacillus persicus]|uniref:Putative peptidoglycan lipid II flippase n=1 Tax=Lentibacillus persicus TaxID=640948 RepID=A0A1I1VUA2_9BACI|nr:murein biosynthesis integral membrane protein MurJ [Lentibacillus persicus]SFD86269.1 putative peptidoglycan lipid II flippase [Lentibacillus persicus]